MSDANRTLEGLLKSWRRAEAQYRAQVEEARAAGTPCEQMYGCACQLRECVRELERTLSKPQTTGESHATVP